MIDFSLLHFMRPWAWWTLPILLAAGWWFWKNKAQTVEWKNYIDPHLANWLLESGKQQHNKLKIWPIIFILAAILVSFSAAGPAWEKQPVAISSLESKAVILLDLSPSMTVEDVSPSRIVRARYKILEILKQWKEGYIALVAYSDDGYIISPLTDDADTISNMVNILSPTIMPAQGSAVDSGLKQAIALLKQSGDGTVDGNILLITDGVSKKRTATVVKLLNDTAVQLSVLSIGTQLGAPIQSSEGVGFITDSKGAIVIAKVRKAPLQAIARAGNGIYLDSKAGNDDIVTWLKFVERTSKKDFSEIEGKEFDKFVDMGPYFLIPLLFLFSYIFRKGFLFTFIFCVITIPQNPLQATEKNSVENDSIERAQLTRSSIWYNSEQLGDEAMQLKDFEQALEHYQNPDKIAEALYRGGHYQESADTYSQLSGAEARYNQANALAQDKKLEDAISNYQQALELKPNFEAAKKNLETVKKLLEQQKQNQQQQDGDGEKKNDNESESKDGNDSDQKQSEQQNSDEASDSNDSKDKQQENSEQDQQDSQSEEEEQEEQDKEQSKSEDKKDDDAENGQQSPQPKTAEEIEAEKQQQQMIEQWLRQINDDPSRLLRNKLRLKQRQRELSGKQSNSEEKEW